MRLPDKNSLLNGVVKAVSLTLIASLTACGGGAHPQATLAPAIQGPAADYPVVVGNPFIIDGVTYTPSDALNYDEVGYSTLDGGDVVGAISAAHRTLPLPSYAEVTSLETGHTILVRVERRGPMTGPFLIALSDGAASQLGITASTPVRVRRVNPPEQERAMLRRGEAAPKRMETPKSLVDVLKRKLPAGGNSTSIAPPEQKSAVPTTSVDSAPAVSAPAPSGPVPVDIAPSYSEPKRIASVPEPTLTSAPRPALMAPTSAQATSVPTAIAEPIPVSKPAPSVKKGFVVQAGAYSTSARAQRVAAGINGFSEKKGRLWHVRTGPFATRKEAQASLAKVVGKGYSDARIYRTD